MEQYNYRLIIAIIFILSIFTFGCTNPTLIHEPTHSSINNLPIETLSHIRTQTPKSTNTPVSTPTSKPTNTPVPTLTSKPSLFSIEDLFDSITLDGDQINFNNWGFTVEIPMDTWNFEPSFYLNKADAVQFVFIRNSFLDTEDTYCCQPSVGIIFFSVPENTQLINFSTIIRANTMGSISIESMFGYDDSQYEFKIPALGYYGHLKDNNEYSVFVIHTVNNTVGVMLTFETPDSILEQARPEFFEILETINFFDTSTLNTHQETISENMYSRLSAIFVSQALIQSGLDLSKGSDGNGSGLSLNGSLLTCKDLSLNLKLYNHFEEISISDFSDLIAYSPNEGDVLIFSGSNILGVTCHASMITRIDGDSILISGQYGPKDDGTYITPGYRSQPVTSLFTGIFNDVYLYRFEY